MKTVDLHVHSIVSDGSYKPDELAELAKAQGLAAFALTDHDVIDGTAEAAAAAKAAGVGFINGMELTTEFQGRKLHIVCLGFDPAHPAFRTVYQRVRAIKEGRIPEMIAFIQRKGVDISLAKVQEFVYDGPLDRYAIMRYLVSLHLYDRAQPLWDHYLDPAAAELGLNFSITAEEALPLIHEAGGATSLAHFHKEIGLQGLSRREQEAAPARGRGRAPVPGRRGRGTWCRTTGSRTAFLPVTPRRRHPVRPISLCIALPATGRSQRRARRRPPSWRLRGWMPMSTPCSRSRPGPRLARSRQVYRSLPRRGAASDLSTSSNSEGGRFLTKRDGSGQVAVYATIRAERRHPCASEGDPRRLSSLAARLVRVSGR